MTTIETAYHHGSHTKLLGEPDPPAGTADLDAIIVPTIRPPAYLRHAVALSRDLGCPLVALCSGHRASARNMTSIIDPAAELLAIDIGDVADLNLPRFATAGVLADTRSQEDRDRHLAQGRDEPDTRFQRGTDIAAKRNLGLALARMLNWRRVVFLDDDIEVSSTDDLRSAAALLDSYSAVGLSIGGFPDNSVVCHAYRDVGGAQESFIGGGALVVETTHTSSFFPDIYNEDWFYMLEDAGLRPMSVTGAVIQNPYEPYRTPERARSEELGDVLAEGVFWLLDEGKTVWDADEEHWADFLDKRRRFIKGVLGRIPLTIGDAAERRRMQAALKASLGRLEYITPSLCVRYLDAWRADRETWRRYITRLPVGVPVRKALDGLTVRGRRKLNVLHHQPRTSAKPAPDFSASPARVSLVSL